MHGLMRPVRHGLETGGKVAIASWNEKPRSRTSWSKCSAKYRIESGRIGDVIELTSCPNGSDQMKPHASKRTRCLSSSINRGITDSLQRPALHKYRTRYRAFDLLIRPPSHLSPSDRTAERPSTRADSASALSARAGRLDDPAQQLLPVGDAELAVDLARVVLHRRALDADVFRDLHDRLAGQEPATDFELPI